ncbi:MAG: S-layer homology domain-containing protein [Clostridia bacterium]|nr:S-layer homology domain-containing protein [Clostridia bacterium]
MLNLKKVIALVCVFALALSTVAFGATYADVPEDSAYYEAVETLTKLDIVEGDDNGYRPEDGVTRAEMAALIARIQGYGETAKGAANTAFSDVPASHWASGYIANASGLGIINGYGDGTFGPEDPVLFEQAVKMIMATLGYTPYAEKNGGYPTGYLAAANRYDVSFNVANAAVGTKANRGTVAQLLAKAIDTPLMVPQSWDSNGNVTYVICDGQNKDYAYYKTLMSENLGYIKVRGVVTETPLVDLAADKTFDTTKEEEVVINVNYAFKSDAEGFAEEDLPKDLTLLVGETDAADYLGQAVVGYVAKLANDKYELVSIAADSNRNEALTIGLSQFTSAADGKAFYLKEGAEKSTEIAVAVDDAETSDIDESLAIIVNNAYYANGGVALNDLMAADDEANKIFGGKITFINNDTDKAYEVAVIEIAGTGVVDDAEDGVVTLKADAAIGTIASIAAIEVDEDEENKIAKIYKDGKEIAVSDLAEYDVLSIIADADADIVYAEVMTNTVIGTVAATKASKTSADGKAYKVDGAWYDLAANANDADDAVANGLGGTFYIDKYGKIAAFNEDAALAGGVAKNFGYIINYDVADADFKTTADVVKVQLLTADGVELLTVKNNAKLDGSVFYTNKDHNSAEGGACNAACVCTDAAITALDTAVAAGGKVVMYTKNAAGELSTLDFADDDKLTKVSTTLAADQEYDAEDSEIGSTGVDADAIVFYVNADAKLSTVGTIAALEDKNAYDVLAVYATDKAEDNDIIVIDAAGLESAGATAGLAVITDIGETYNDDEELVYVVSYLVDGAEVEGLLTTEDVKTANADLTIGDIVKVKSVDNVVTSIEVVFDLTASVRSNFTAVALENAYAYDEKTDEVIIGGKVTAYNKANNKATIDDVVTSAEVAEVRLGQAKNTYVIDVNSLGDVTVGKGSYKYFSAIYGDNLTTNVKVKKGDAEATKTVAEAMEAADYVYVRKYDNKVVDVVIVRGATSVTKIAD